jgi:hypothetical protein
VASYLHGTVTHLGLQERLLCRDACMEAHLCTLCGVVCAVRATETVWSLQKQYWPVVAQGSYLYTCLSKGSSRLFGAR